MPFAELPGLTTQAVGRALYYFDTLDSTNNYCKDHAVELPDGAVVVAGAQSAAKGSRGRAWSAGPGQCLAMTVLCKHITPSELPVLPLLAGLAVSRGLEALCGIPFPIKWSNDVLQGDKKVCGILCESRTLGQESFAVMGMGTNLTQTAGDFSRHGLVYAQSLLLATGKKYDSAAVAAVICNELEPVLLFYRKNGFAGELREDYKARCRTLGQFVRLDDGSSGTAVDIGADGGLVCSIDGALRTVFAGEVSVRGLYGYA